MKKIISTIVLGCCISLSSVQAAPVVLGFDDVFAGQNPGDFASLSQSYAGLTWDTGVDWGDSWQVLYTDQAYYPSASGDYVAFSWGESIGVSFAAPVQFNGAYFSGYAGMTFDLYFHNSLVHTSDTLTVSTEGTPAQWLSSGYTNLVDRVVVRSDWPTYWTMDNFTYASPIPEPEMYAMLLAGLAMLRAQKRMAATKRS